MFPSAEPCVLLCTGSASGTSATDVMGFANPWVPYAVGSAGDENVALSFIGSGVPAVWIGVTGSGSDFVEPGSGDHQAPNTFWGSGQPTIGAIEECVLVTGSGWVEQDCSALPPHPFLLFAPPAP